MVIYSVPEMAEEKRSSDGIWEGKVVVEMREEGKDYDPRSFDQFSRKMLLSR